MTNEKAVPLSVKLDMPYLSLAMNSKEDVAHLLNGLLAACEQAGWTDLIDEDRLVGIHQPAVEVDSINLALQPAWAMVTLTSEHEWRAFIYDILTGGIIHDWFLEAGSEVNNGKIRISVDCPQKGVRISIPTDIGIATTWIRSERDFQNVLEHLRYQAKWFGWKDTPQEDNDAP